MQLKELSETTGVSPASIKYYLREGLLPAGESLNATRASYSGQHVSRLRLIQVLRDIVGLGIQQIRDIVTLADAEASRLELLATVQRIVLGLQGVDGSDGGEGAKAGDAVVRMRGWPDESSDARSAVNTHLALMEAHGVRVPLEILDAYSRAVDGIADADLAATTAPDDVNDLIRTAAVGMHLHSQLVLKLLALAQASHAIRRYRPGPLSGTAGASG